MADVLDLTDEIVSAHVCRNSTKPDQLPDLIRSVFAALTQATQPEREPLTKEPAVSVRKSVFSDHLVCLECGRNFRTLKRHLDREHETTAQEYRERFSLPHNYPLVAPDYAQTRSDIAKQIGLGRRRRPKRARGRR